MGTRGFGGVDGAVKPAAAVRGRPLDNAACPRRCVGKVGQIALGEESNLFRVGVTPKVREDVGILCTWAVDAGRAACRIARMQRGVGGNHETHLTSGYGCARG